MSDHTEKSPTTKRYPKEFKERAVRMVCELRAETEKTHGSIQRVAGQLGCGVESLRSWMKRADIDAGERPGTSTEDNRRIRELQQEVRELAPSERDPAFCVGFLRGGAVRHEAPVRREALRIEGGGRPSRRAVAAAW